MISVRTLRLAALLVVVAAIAATLGHQSPASSPSPSKARPPGGVDADLRRAVRRAARAAAPVGVTLRIESGRRSPERQEQLRREAIAKYGSEAEAARWVATPETSPHVSGDAVDIGPPAAAAWLAAHGAAYGLCRIYANEPWHYELRPQAVGHGCPPMYADPTHDPRMQHDEENPAAAAGRPRDGRR